MKKLIVFTLTGAFIIGVFLLGGARRQYSPPSMYARQNEVAAGAADFDQAFGKEEREVAKSMRALAPPPPSEPMPIAAAPSGGLGGLGVGRGGGGIGDMSASSLGQFKGKTNKVAVLKKDAAPSESASDAESGGAEAAPRAWFPETFLFEPLIVTDAAGRANVPVKVPDRLTTWRVLALAHARQGAQAGAVASFLGTLPTYIEPVTPPMLYAGDSVRVPVQVVNTTAEDITSSVRFQSSGATLSATGGPVRVPGAGNAIQYVTLTTSKPGSVLMKATLGDTDAVERTIDVLPAGKRELVSRGGSLAAPRTFELDGPANALPGSEQVRLRVFPGALGLVRSELSAAPGRGGLAEDAYLLQVLGRAPALLRALGAEPDLATIRDLSILATQRVMQHARAPSVDAATMLTEASLQHPDNPVLARLGERLANQVASSQRPDGTCQGANGWSLQRLMVTTSECVRAVQASKASPKAAQRAKAVSLKASGAFERNLARIQDGYTAAAVLASGSVSGTVADALKAVVLAGIQQGDDGAKYLEVNKGTVRSDGAMPSRAEATALAVLALQGDDKAPLADLGTYLLAGYNPISGWGDGRANLVCLRAVSELFKDAVPAGVQLTLERDGKVMAEGLIDASKIQQVISLDANASGSSGKHTWSVKANPPVAGLGYSLTLVAYTPWRDTPGGGLELTTEVPQKLEVGKAAELAVTASMPGGLLTKVRLALPAGVQADANQLSQLVSSNVITRFETEDGAITLHLPALANGAVFKTKIRVIPTLAGRLQSGASQLGPEYAALASLKAFAPKTWDIR